MAHISSTPTVVASGQRSSEKEMVTATSSSGSSHRLGANLCRFPFRHRTKQTRPMYRSTERVHSFAVYPSELPETEDVRKSVSFSTYPQLPPPVQTCPAARPLKIKVISWNMHDSLPKVCSSFFISGVSAHRLQGKFRRPRCCSPLCSACLGRFPVGQLCHSCTMEPPVSLSTETSARIARNRVRHRLSGPTLT